MRHSGIGEQVQGMGGVTCTRHCAPVQAVERLGNRGLGGDEGGGGGGGRRVLAPERAKSGNREKRNWRLLLLLFPFPES
jgi:hypothetical protein